MGLVAIGVNHGADPEYDRDEVQGAVRGDGVQDVGAGLTAAGRLPGGEDVFRAFQVRGS